MAKTAREIMTGSAECIGENDSIVDAAKMMAKMDIGAMPICGEDNRLKGMITDRDIAVKVIAEGRDPSQVKAGELGRASPSPSAPTTRSVWPSRRWPTTAYAVCP